MPAPQGLTAALGAAPEATYATGALGDLLAVFDNEAAVRALAPDFGAVARLARREGIRGIIATASAPGGAAGYDFVSRFFAPADGIPEDPVTGSAHTALAPFWSGRLGRDGLTGLQASARGGLVRTSLHGDRVHLTGQRRRRARRHADRRPECGRRDSNPQGLRHRHLKPACLPISPRPLARNRRTRPAPDCMVRRHGRG